MKVRLPLSLQFVGFLLLHLVVLFLLFLFFFNTQFGMGWEALIASPAGERVEGISRVMREQLKSSPNSSWNAILAGFGNLYNVTFYIFDRRGRQIAGEPVTLPEQVVARVTRKHPPNADRENVNADHAPIPADIQQRWREHGLHGRILLHTNNPDRFWICVRFGIPVNRDEANAAEVMPTPDGPMIPGTLLAACPNFWSSRILFDFGMLLSAIGSIILLSVVIWWPFVFSITRAIAQLTAMTERIAQGRFDARLKVNRSDEIGQLAEAVNSMAERLDNFVAGQKRFLGDTAHELCSPISRLHIALELLESSVTEEQELTIKDIREDVDEMSNLINDLLAFSKAGLQGKELQLSAVNLGTVLQTVMSKTCSEKLVKVDFPADVFVFGDNLLLERALANVIRNAVRYASQDGPIHVNGVRSGAEFVITITDSGPGVPAESIKMLGEPFFRPEPSRSRSSGGVGLGLSIVKSCVETCGGSFTVRNHQPKGLQVELRLKSYVATQRYPTDDAGKLNDSFSVH